MGISKRRPASMKVTKAREKAPGHEDNPQLKLTAHALFHPVDRNPYMFNGKPLGNLQELVDYLVAFTGEEGNWVASWLEYLGDGEVAEKIREHPHHFKDIVRERCHELKKYA